MKTLAFSRLIRGRFSNSFSKLSCHDSPIFGIVLDPARIQEELDAAGVAFGSCKVEGSPTVIVTKVHVHSLLVRAVRKRDNLELEHQAGRLFIISILTP